MIAGLPIWLAVACVALDAGRCRRAGCARDRHGNDRVAVAGDRRRRFHPRCDRDLGAAAELGGDPPGAPPHRSARRRPGAARAGTGRGPRGDRHRLGGPARTGPARVGLGAARRRRVVDRRALPPDTAGVGDRRRHVGLHRHRHRGGWAADGDHVPEHRSARRPSDARAVLRGRRRDVDGGTDDLGRDGPTPMAARAVAPAGRDPRLRRIELADRSPPRRPGASVDPDAVRRLGDRARSSKRSSDRETDSVDRTRI